MASNKTFNTRIQLKYDTYSNWQDKDPVLLSGEIAVVVVPASTGVATDEPTVLFKVGDGTSRFSALQFTAGLAADVYDWAKAATKPTYDASEISNLASYIAGKVQDTNTKYKIEVDSSNNRKFNLYSQELGVSSWTLTSTITIPDETVYTLTTGTSNGTVKFNGTDVAVKGLGSAAYTASSAYDAAGAANAVKGYSSDADTAATVYGARNLAQKGINNAATAQSAANKAQSEVDALETLVGSIPSGSTATTIIGYVNEQINAIPAPTDYTVSITTSMPTGVAKRYTITQNATGLSTDIDIPKDMVVESGTVETKTTAGDWGDPGTYLHLILANATSDSIWINVNGLIEYVTSGSKTGDIVVINVSSDHKVTATITDGTITIGKLDSTTQDKINTAYNNNHTHSNKSVIDGITSTKITNWDTAYTNNHTHSNKTVLDGISSTSVADWNDAVSKEHTHSNKSVLDGIAATDITNWNSKAAGNHSHNIKDLTQTSSTYITLNCGSASVNI